MNKVLIIAEAGVNHNGSFETAKMLIDQAALANADFVKFQTFNADKLVSKTAKKAEYQLLNSNNEDDSQYNMLKQLEMPFFWHNELKKYAEEKKIGFLSTGFDEESIDLLDEMGMAFFKISSGEITNKPFLSHVAKKLKPIVLSSGMSTIKEIEQAIAILENEGLKKEQISILHCNTEYPTPMTDVNLLALNQIKDQLGVNVGYSDHTLGIEVSIAAVALGATIIEKHFTLDRTMVGPDHSASLEPNELKEMVKGIRNIELAISGSGIKEPSESELKNINIARRSIHLKQGISRNEVIKRGDLIMNRPGDGISPMDIDKVIGQKVISDLPVGYQLKWSDLNK